MIDDGQTCSLDSSVQEFRIKIHSLCGIHPNQLKDLIQTKYKVLLIEQTNRQDNVVVGTPDFNDPPCIV